MNPTADSNGVVCPLCSKTFLRVSHFRTHLVDGSCKKLQDSNVFDDEQEVQLRGQRFRARPACPDCGETFSQNSNLKRYKAAGSCAALKRNHDLYNSPFYDTGQVNFAASFTSHLRRSSSAPPVMPAYEQDSLQSSTSWDGVAQQLGSDVPNNYMVSPANDLGSLSSTALNRTLPPPSSHPAGWPYGSQGHPFISTDQINPQSQYSYRPESQHGALTGTLVPDHNETAQSRVALAGPTRHSSNSPVDPFDQRVMPTQPSQTASTSAPGSSALGWWYNMGEMAELADPSILVSSESSFWQRPSAGSVQVTATNPALSRCYESSIEPKLLVINEEPQRSDIRKKPALQEDEDPGLPPQPNSQLEDPIVRKRKSPFDILGSPYQISTGCPSSSPGNPLIKRMRTEKNATCRQPKLTCKFCGRGKGWLDVIDFWTYLVVAHRDNAAIGERLKEIQQAAYSWREQYEEDGIGNVDGALGLMLS